MTPVNSFTPVFLFVQSPCKRDVTVVEVNRHNRQNRRRRGKSDTVDAEAAASAVLNDPAAVTPKAGTGPVEVE